jgi:hypothetical protein
MTSPQEQSRFNIVQWNLESDIPNSTEQYWEDVLYHPVKQSILLQ